MSKTQKIVIYLGVLVAFQIASRVYASTFFVDGKEVTKGEALIAKARNPKLKIIKQDEMEISDKGTLKAVKR